MSEQIAPGHSDRTETSGDEAETADRLLHGSSFGAAAAAYAEHRPGYAEAAVRWALEPVRDRQPVRVADVGSTQSCSPRPRWASSGTARPVPPIRWWPPSGRTPTSW